MESLTNNVMNINKIEDFSKLYNEVALFFSKYEPQQYNICSDSYYSSMSKVQADWKVIKPGSMSHNACQFVDWFKNFKEVLYDIVLLYRKEIFQDSISYYFKSYLYIPKSSMLIQCSDGDNIELLNNFMNATEFVNNISGHGLKDEYDSFKEEAERKKTGLISGEQVDEENYLDDEELDMFIQKINDDSHTLAHELVHKFFNSGVVGLPQNNNQWQKTLLYLPRELDTAEAKEYFSNAILAGFMDEDYQWKGTKYQAALFAEICSEKLGLKHKWKPFEILWGVRHMAQTRRESKERFGKVDKEYEIEAIFK